MTNPPDTTRREGSWPQGVTLALQGILPTMGVMLLVPVVPLLMREFGHLPAAPYLVPSLLTVPALCIALFSVAAGYLGDKFGHRRVLLSGLACYAVAGVAPFFLSAFPAILASRVLLGLCEAAIITLSATLIGEYFTGKQRDRWLGLTATAASLAAIVFAGISGILGDALGWRGPVLVYALSIFFIPAMLRLTWEPATRQKTAEEAQERFPWRHMAAVAATTLAGSILFYSITVQQGAALAALGLERARSIGFLTALTSVGVPVGTLLFVRLTRLSTPTLLAFAFSLLGLSFVGISQADDYQTFAAAAFVGLLGAGVLLPTLLTWTARGLPHGVRGRGMGMFQSVFALGQFGSGLLIPAISRNVTGDIPSAFGLLGLAALALALAAGMAWAKKPPEQRTGGLEISSSNAQRASADGRP